MLKQRGGTPSPIWMPRASRQVSYRATSSWMRSSCPGALWLTAISWSVHGDPGSELGHSAREVAPDAPTARRRAGGPDQAAHPGGDRGHGSHRSRASGSLGTTEAATGRPGRRNQYLPDRPAGGSAHDHTRKGPSAVRANARTPALGAARAASGIHAVASEVSGGRAG